jgi:hypothetical protein
MTICELERFVESKMRVEKLRLQERATYDYILADTIGKSVARLLNSGATMPTLAEVYPTIFEAENNEVKQEQAEKIAELSALRFELFAQSFNKRFVEVAKPNE